LRKDANNRESIRRHADIRARFLTLSGREKEVLQLVVEGRANKVIALDLGLSERTVEVHRGNIMDKMGAQSLAHLVRMHMIIQSSIGGS
jgi:FixJ family two-component response regulator